MINPWWKMSAQNITISLTFLHDGNPYHIETSPLSCFANQWTGFGITRTSVMKELRPSRQIRSVARILQVVGIRQKGDLAIWRALLSCYILFYIRPFALLSTKYIGFPQTYKMESF